jgi:amino acid transporter
MATSQIGASTAEPDGSSRGPVRAGRAPREGVGLMRGALGFPSVLMQGVAQIAPAIGLVGAIAFNTQLAGLGAPSTFLAAFVVALMVAVTIGQLAKFLPSAGGLGTYVSASVTPSAGFVVGWLYSWLAAAATGGAASFTGYIMQSSIRAEYNVDITWQYWAFAILALTTFVTYRGIRVSGKALVVFFDRRDAHIGCAGRVQSCVSWSGRSRLRRSQPR